jgi:O-methyltransferase
MASGSEHLSPGLSDYLAGHSTPPDALLRDLTAETAERFPDHLRMQIGHQQGTFLTMLAGLMEARHAVEVGTFTGYSSICLARGMATDGKLICCDISEEWTSVARTYWQKAGLADRIDLRLGPPGRPYLYKFVIEARPRPVSATMTGWVPVPTRSISGYWKTCGRRSVTACWRREHGFPPATGSWPATGSVRPRPSTRCRSWPPRG